MTKPIFAYSDASNPDKILETKVPLGLNLVFYGLELTALAIIGMMVLPFLMSGNLQNLILIIRIIQFLGYVLLVASIMSFTGKLYCLSAPDEMEGKNAIYGAVALDCVVILIQILEWFRVMSQFVTYLSNLMIITAFACFLLFLLNLARHLKNEDLATAAEGLLKLLFGLMVASLLMVASTFMPFPGFAILILGLVTLILAVISLLRYSRLLLNFKRVLASKSS